MQNDRQGDDALIEAAAQSNLSCRIELDARVAGGDLLDRDLHLELRDQRPDAAVGAEAETEMPVWVAVDDYSLRACELGRIAVRSAEAEYHVVARVQSRTAKIDIPRQRAAEISRRGCETNYFLAEGVDQRRRGAQPIRILAMLRQPPDRGRKGDRGGIEAADQDEADHRDLLVERQRPPLDAATQDSREETLVGRRSNLVR